jgi:hypothetical protein
MDGRIVGGEGDDRPGDRLIKLCLCPVCLAELVTDSRAGPKISARSGRLQSHDVPTSSCLPMLQLLGQNAELVIWCRLWLVCGQRHPSIAGRRFSSSPRSGASCMQMRMNAAIKRVVHSCRSSLGTTQLFLWISRSRDLDGPPPDASGAPERRSRG